MNQVQANRLLNVAVALRDAHKDELLFDMSVYGYNPTDDPIDIYIEDPKHTCGTPACAIGHFAARTDLQKMYTLQGGDLAFTKKHGGLTCGHNNPLTSEYFGLDYAELDQLFDSDGCGQAETALSAAQYIEGFIRKKGFDIVLED